MAGKKERPFSLIEREVIQRRVYPLPDYNMHYKACNTLALPPSSLSPALESFRYQYCLPDYSCEDIGVYPPG